MHWYAKLVSIRDPVKYTELVHFKYKDLWDKTYAINDLFNLRHVLFVELLVGYPFSAGIAQNTM